MCGQKAQLPKVFQTQPTSDQLKNADARNSGPLMCLRTCYISRPKVIKLWPKHLSGTENYLGRFSVDPWNHGAKVVLSILLTSAVSRMLLLISKHWQEQGNKKHAEASACGHHRWHNAGQTLSLWKNHSRIAEGCPIEHQPPRGKKQCCSKCSSD